MRPGGRVSELLLDPDKGPFIWFFGFALLLAILLGGIFAVIAIPTWAERCVDQGGEYVYEQVPWEGQPGYWSDNERCDLP